MMAVEVPPIPLKTPMLTRDGYLSDTWVGFFRQVFLRIGGSSATDLTTLQNTVSAHSAAITTLQGQVNDLNQGPTL